MTVQGDRPLSRRELRDRTRDGSGAPVEPERYFPPEQEPGASGEGDAPADGWNRPLPSDLAAPERTMTRRELRLLRERAEAAGQPAPDVVFLPSGEATVTGMIPVVGPAAERTPPVEPAPTVEPVEQVEQAEQAEPVEPAEQAEQAEPVEQAEQAEQGPAAEQVPIPALIEPLPSSGVRFSTDAGRADATAVPEVATAPEESADETGSDPAGEEPVLVAVAEADEATTTDAAPDEASGTAPEIVVDAEPVTGPITADTGARGGAAGADPAIPIDTAVSLEGASEETTDASADDVTGGTGGAPAPSTLRPFDASFRRSGRRADPVAVAAEDPGIDDSAAPLAADADGVRADILAAPDSGSRTAAHWSDGADDTTVDAPTAFSRDVGVTTGAVTTHALVLPTIPDVGDPLLSPLTSTGEIMVTGTIDLPRSFGSTGAHPALFDHPEVDALLDESDREDADSTAAPVRASRAVSSTTTTRAMIDADDGRRSRLLPIVLICSLVVGVAAAAFLVAAFVFNVI